MHGYQVNFQNIYNIYVNTILCTGPYGSIDEQTIGFKGKCSMTTVIKFKKEGDGFLVDCWADGGYTYAFYFRNDLPPAKYKATGLSALHKRCLAIYDSLPHKNYKV